MKCTIPGSNIKAFGRSIHSLAKIGDELYIEPMQHGLGLRTVNSSYSAYACFIFAPGFFQHYDDGSPSNAEATEESLKCKVTMKSCLTVFKNVSSLEKTVDKCKITLDNKEDRLVFQLYCRHGIVKTHNLSYIECETLQAVFSKDLCPNLLTAQTKLLQDAVLNFQNNQEEVTLTVRPDKLTLKNYTDDEPDPTKVMHTELTLDASEFDNYQVGVDSDITFCLKELRAILGFTEGCSLPLSVHFETAGKPVVFSLDEGRGYEGNFVLATLAADDSGSSQRSTQQKHANPTANITKSTSIASKRSVNDNLSINKRDKVRNQGDVSRQDSVPRSTAKPPREGKTNQQKRTRSDASKQMDVALEELMNDDLDDLDVGAMGEPHRTPTREHRDASREQDMSSSSPEIPLQTIGGAIGTDDEDVLPGTPPSKRFKSLFFGMSQQSTSSGMTSSKHVPVVLAGDSDSEPD
ncbi:unnamed protein product [Owenia fusiformis]|uniref:Cell cycle checkpoint control protein n=1 Tax=Owenia fusiformis TaxID=6347 RepID=A0A8J1TM66_OWEFU|nr:unnamed protein product [Owenia fusiformis]